MTDRERHIELARATGSWSSWVVDSWFTNRMMTIRTPAPFTEDRVLEFYCSCRDQDYPDAAHRSSTDLPCSFLDYYGRRKSQTREVRRSIQRLLPMLESLPVLAHKIEGDRLQHPTIEIFRLPYPDGTWVAFQARYVDTANRVARVERWELRAGTTAQHNVDILIGLRDSEIVAAIMPACVEGSRYESVQKPCGYGSRDEFPRPASGSTVQAASS